MRTAAMGALAAVVLCAAGCGTKLAPPEPAPKAGGSIQITIDVKGMTKALEIT